MSKLIVEDIELGDNNTFTGVIKRGVLRINIKGKFTLEFVDNSLDLSIATPWISGISAPNLIDIDDLIDKVSAEYNYQWFTDNEFS